MCGRKMFNRLNGRRVRVKQLLFIRSYSLSLTLSLSAGRRRRRPGMFPNRVSNPFYPLRTRAWPETEGWAYDGVDPTEIGSWPIVH